MPDSRITFAMLAGLIIAITCNFAPCRSMWQLDYVQVVQEACGLWCLYLGSMRLNGTNSEDWV